MEECVRLSEGFRLRDVLGGGASFKIMPSNMTEAELQPATNAFEGANHIPLIRTDIFDPEGDQSDSPFERHRKRMKNVTADGSVKKFIHQHGAGDTVPPDSFVTFHYNAYAEYQDEPHDSTILRGKPWHIKMDSGALLPGLEIGIRSMRKHEKADILVQPHMAFGKIGSPPRIPPDAEILYEVELIEITSEPTPEILEDIDASQLSESIWERTGKQVKRLLLEGNDLHNNKNEQKAIRAYQSATKLAVNCNLKDEKEEDEQTNLLARLYLNMAVVNFELKNYNDVCLNCKNALDLKIVVPTTEKGLLRYVKAHLFWGKALTFLNELDKAHKHLKEALDKKPDEPTAHKALQLLDQKKKQAKESDLLFWRKALQVKEEPTKNQDKVENCSSKPSAWQNQLLSFKNNPEETRMKLPGNIDRREIDALIAEAKALTLKAELAGGCIVISKMP